MRFRTKESRVHIGRIIFGALFVVCLSIICRTEPINIESFKVKAESSDSNLVVEYWDYFSGLEKTYRIENPNVTYEEMVLYLESKISEVEQGDVIIPVGDTNSESSYDKLYQKLTSAERELILQHPIRSIIVFCASEDARVATEDFYGNPDSVLNNGDAFRHAYWNALMTKRMNKDIAKEFADAHEYGQTGIASQMDLLNNQIGRNDGETYSSLNDGKLAFKIMVRVSEGNYWQIIDDNLVATDEVGLLSEYVTEYTITLVWYDG